MKKDRQMYALIAAIFISVLLITGWVFTDRNVMDLISATPIIEMRNTAPVSAAVTDASVVLNQSAGMDAGSCFVGEVCK